MRADQYEALHKDQLISMLVDRDHEIDKLHHILHQANKKLFGQKSEKQSVLQQELFTVEPGEEAPVPSPETIEVPSYKRAVRQTKKPLSGQYERKSARTIWLTSTALAVRKR